MSATTTHVPPVGMPFESDERLEDERRRAINEASVLDPKTDGAPLDAAEETEKGEGKRKGGGRRRIVLCVLLLLLLAVGSLAAIIYAFGSGGAKQEGPKLKVTADPNKNGGQMSSDEDKYTAAINALATESKPAGTNPLETSTADLNSQSGLDPLSPNSGLRNETQGSVGPDSAETSEQQQQSLQGEGQREGGGVRSQNQANEGTGAGAGLVAKLTGKDTSTSARSLPFSALTRIAPASSSLSESRPADSNTSPSTGNSGSSSETKGGIPVPPFGTMLPVRSLGMIYTLRSSGGLVRLELTREMSGRGWSLPKGTIMIGALRGSETDRAFISIVGFIDTQSGGLVKVTGDVLGGDGASGVRGRKKKVSSGFSRVFQKLGEAGLGVLNTMAASVGRGTVVVTDVYSRGVAPVTSEVTGLIGNKSGEFVEVKAGSVCYVMITQLPGEVQGVEALAKLSSQSLSQLAASGQPRTATGLSEMELAELISRGVPSEIRAALPRMTPDMRRVAEAVLADAGGR